VDDARLATGEDADCSISIAAFSFMEMVAVEVNGGLERAFH
jgi:hypothetical protein